MWYKVVGVFRCPYREKCGPDKSRIPWAEDYENAVRTCNTIRHHRCPRYCLSCVNERESKKPGFIEKVLRLLAFEPRFERNLKTIK